MDKKLNISLLLTYEDIIGLFCVQKMEEIKMLESLVIVVCAIVVVAACVFAWWIENGPEKKSKEENENKAEGGMR